jgi:hypothetical protein
MDFCFFRQAFQFQGRPGDQRPEGHAMKSPCVDVCIMDADSGLCQGCLRTLDEIARWSQMSEIEREQVVAALPRRKKSGERGLDGAS